MLNYEDIRFDCRLYNGYKPCRYGSACVGCPHYESLNMDADLSAAAGIVTDGAAGDGLLIIKTGALGDVLRTTSLLPALASHYPGTPIDWVTTASAVPLLWGNPYIRHIYTLDTREELELLASRRDWHRVYCYEKGDFPLELAGRVTCSFHYGFGPNASGKPVAFNKASRYALMLGLDDELKFSGNTKPYSQVICEAAELPYHRSPYVLVLSETAIGACRTLRARFSGKPTVGLNTGCGPVFATKRWTPDAWMRLAHILHQKFPDVNIALLGGKSEAEVNNLIAEACPFVIDTGSDNSLDEFCGVADACDVIVTADSLCMHIGIALKKRVVAVFGSTSDVEIDLFDCGEHVVAQAECRPCFKKACPYSEDEFAVCMKGLDPQIVAEAVERQLASCSMEVSGC